MTVASSKSPLAMMSKLRSTLSKMDLVRRVCHAKKRNARKPGKRLESAFEAAEAITGIINGKVKGGFTVDIDDIRAFLPGSLVDVRPVRDTTYLEGKPLEFKVIKLDQRRNNVVVSRRAVVESENSAEREALLENLQEGATIDGVVKNLTDYGVCGLGWHRRPPAHHRHGVEARQASYRGGERWR